MKPKKQDAKAAPDVLLMKKATILTVCEMTIRRAYGSGRFSPARRASNDRPVSRLAIVPKLRKQLESRTAA